jgi:nucleoside 2-deoxyribosyltransferase
MPGTLNVFASADGARLQRRMPKRIYLAGPEVFLPNAEEIGERKKAICRKHGLEGEFPADIELDDSTLEGSKRGWQISRANEDLMCVCDLLIANMTPFRGPSMDVGTAFEMGFMRALGRPILGYTNSDKDLLSRTKTYLAGRFRRRNGVVEDSNRMFIEDYGFAENLMVEGAVLSSRSEVIRTAVPPRKRFTDLAGFTRCVKMARRILAAR